MKYGELNLGQIEAVVNKLGGMDGLRRFLADELVVQVLPGIGVRVAIDPSKPFSRDMAREGWRLESDLEYRKGKVTFELAEFLNQGEGSVKGNVMAERAKTLGANLGQKHAEALLENQHLIPKEWREFYLVFPGTVWRDSLGDRSVPYLCWCDGQWRLGFCWLERDFLADDRLVRSRK